MEVPIGVIVLTRALDRQIRDRSHHESFFNVVTHSLLIPPIPLVVLQSVAGACIACPVSGTVQLSFGFLTLTHVAEEVCVGLRNRGLS